MSLAKCRECKGEVSTEAGSCPHCGAPGPASASLTASTAPPKHKSYRLRTLLLTVLALVAISVISNAVREGRKTPEERAADKERAAAAKASAEAQRQRDLKYAVEIKAPGLCRVAVEERLKAPSIATFQQEERIGFDEAKGVAIIIGAVDAQNSFGAKIRTHYTCELARVADGWSVKTIAFEK